MSAIPNIFLPIGSKQRQTDVVACWQGSISLAVTLKQCSGGGYIHCSAISRHLYDRTIGDQTLIYR